MFLMILMIFFEIILPISDFESENCQKAKIACGVEKSWKILSESKLCQANFSSSRMWVKDVLKFENYSIKIL